MHELKAVRKKRMRIETKRKQIQESLSDFKQKQVELNNEIENIKVRLCDCVCVCMFGCACGCEWVIWGGSYTHTCFPSSVLLACLLLWPLHHTIPCQPQANAESEGEKKMKEQQRLLDKLEGQLTKFEADYKTATDGYYQSREAVEQYKDQLDALASKVQAAKKQTKTALENLKVVQSGSKDRLAAYGKEMMALHKAIQKESSWKGHAPIGPIGLHIEPVDASWYASHAIVPFTPCVSMSLLTVNVFFFWYDLTLFASLSLICTCRPVACSLSIILTSWIHVACLLHV